MAPSAEAPEPANEPDLGQDAAARQHLAAPPASHATLPGAARARLTRGRSPVR